MLGYTTAICIVGILHMATIPCISRQSQTGNFRNISECAARHNFSLSDHVYVGVCTDKDVVNLYEDLIENSVQLSLQQWIYLKRAIPFVDNVLKLKRMSK